MLISNNKLLYALLDSIDFETIRKAFIDDTADKFTALTAISLDLDATDPESVQKVIELKEKLRALFHANADSILSIERLRDAYGVSFFKVYSNADMTVLTEMNTFIQDAQKKAQAFNNQVNKEINSDSNGYIENNKDVITAIIADTMG